MQKLNNCLQQRLLNNILKLKLIPILSREMLVSVNSQIIWCNQPKVMKTTYWDTEKSIRKCITILVLMSLKGLLPRLKPKEIRKGYSLRSKAIKERPILLHQLIWNKIWLIIYQGIHQLRMVLWSKVEQRFLTKILVQRVL